MNFFVVSFLLVLFSNRVASYFKVDNFTTNSNLRYANAVYDISNGKDGDVIVNYDVEFKTDILKEQVSTILEKS